MWYILLGIGIVIYLMMGMMCAALCTPGYVREGEEWKAALSMFFVCIFWLPIFIIVNLS